jgi:hypothetical protein
VRAQRGISLEVWNARPYTWWEPSDLTPIEEAYAGLTRPQVSFMKKLARQHPGWIIHRHAVLYAPHVWPEIRPEDRVRTGPPDMHWHGTGEAPDLPAGYQVLKRGSKAWQEHCAKVNADDAADPRLKPHEACQEPHWHENKAKYVFPTAEKVLEEWWHDHEAERTKAYYAAVEGALEDHMRRYHIEEPEPRADGKHLHYRRVSSDESLARRLDMHPMAADRLEAAEVVYFGIEGCLKADSILSAIIEEDRPESVFSVPSVSLWAASEFDSFVPRLRGKTVVVVPDGDWYTKDQVLLHARFAQRYLTHRGINAVVAAPPRASGLKGVDDFLGKGGRLDDLEVLDRAPSERIPEILEYRRGHARADAMRNVTRMIYDLAYFADKDGYVQVGLRTFGKILKLSPKAAGDRLKTMRDWAWIEIEQQSAEGEWEPVQEKIPTKSGYVSRGRYWNGPEQFKRKTRVRVIEEFRCEDLAPVPLEETLQFRQG